MIIRQNKETLKLKVRKDKEGDLRDHLGLAISDGKVPVRLLEIRQVKSRP